MPRGARRQAQPSPEEFPFRHGRKDRQSGGQTSTARVGGNQSINDEEWIGASCCMLGLGEEEGEGRLWISFCSIQGGRLHGGGEVLRRFPVLTTSLVGKEGKKRVPVWAEQDSEAQRGKVTR